jgi:hypothetical protein
MFWNLTYPDRYRSKDPDGPFSPGLPILVGAPLKEWSPLPVVHVGLAYAFHRPFF